MTQTMREQIQELVDRWHNRGIPSILWVLEELKRIIATSPPVVSVKPGWVCKDAAGIWWSEKAPYWTENPDRWNFLCGHDYQWCIICITDPWPDHPNGGPECILEIKP